MSRITSGIGLVTGIPIEDTVNQLIAVSAQPRDLLASRNEGLQAEQLAIDTLSTRVLSLQFSLNSLNASTVFKTTAVSSNNADALAATIQQGATPAVGDYLLQPVRTASAQQFVSQRFESVEDVFGNGGFSFRFGGFANHGISLDELNSGAGISRGVIRITDRSGATADIDLSLAQSVDDVLSAINQNTQASIRAEVVGDAIRINDLSGGAGTLNVTDIGLGTTAADLGLDGISTTSATATGQDVFTLHAGTKLRSLNDGNGVYFTDDVSDVDDLLFSLADGSTDLGVDLSGAATLGDVADAINNDEDLTEKVTAAISADGARLELTDLTSGGGTFAVANGVLGTAAEDLGLTESAVGGTITGRRLSSGLAGTLLTSLNGGSGVGSLGQINVADKSGVIGTVDLSAAETLTDVIEAINSSSARVVASINSARNGILLTDESGGSGNLLVANGDASNSATALGIEFDEDVTEFNSGSLNRQTLSETTLLSSFNGGQGIEIGDIQLVDSEGETRTVNLDSPGNEATTIGDVLDAINLSGGSSVSARINDAGDGILVTDVAGGSGNLTLKDTTGDVAKALNLTRAAVAPEQAPSTQIVDGSATFVVEVSDLESSGSAATLASLNDGAGIPAGDFIITDSAGASLAIDLNGADSGVTTIGQLIDAINQRASQFGVEVTASLNSGGTGIQLVDAAGGSGELSVRDVNSTTAADLRLTGAVANNLDAGTQTIDGAGLFAASSDASDDIQVLADRINELDAGVAASIVFDGIGYRLAIATERTGAVNALLLDAGGTSFQFQETSKAQDALLLYGSAASASAGLLLSSPDNKFNQVIDDVDLEVRAASTTPVTISVETDQQVFVDAVQEFVDAYNAIRDDLAELTVFDAESASTGLLFGTNAALQVDTRLSRVLTDRFFGVGSFESLESIGVSVDDQGKLTLSPAQLLEAFENDPADVEKLLRDPQAGLITKLTNEIDRLAGDETSLLGARSQSLKDTIELNADRIDFFNEQLDRERERLLLQFFQLEQIIAGLQQNLTTLDNLQPVPPLVSTSS